MSNLIQSVAKGTLSSGISTAGGLIEKGIDTKIQQARLNQEYKIKEAEYDNDRKDRIMRAIGNIHGPLSLITTGVGLLKTKGRSLTGGPESIEVSDKVPISEDEHNRNVKALEKELSKKKPSNIVVHELRTKVDLGKKKFNKGGSK